MKCPGCKALVPSSAEMCGECGYDFPSPDNIELVTIPNLILMAAALISSAACLFAAFVFAVTFFTRTGPSAVEAFLQSLAGTIVAAAMTIVFLRSMR